jgi:hypothetical protein
VFAWRYLDDAGSEVGMSHGFADREDAEGWIGETWADLHERGVEDVELIDQDRGRRLYRMGLGDVTPTTP